MTARSTPDLNRALPEFVRKALIHKLSYYVDSVEIYEGRDGYACLTIHYQGSKADWTPPKPKSGVQKITSKHKLTGAKPAKKTRPARPAKTDRPQQKKGKEEQPAAKTAPQATQISPEKVDTDMSTSSVPATPKWPTFDLDKTSSKKRKTDTEVQGARFFAEPSPKVAPSPRDHPKEPLTSSPIPKIEVNEVDVALGKYAKVSNAKEHNRSFRDTCSRGKIVEVSPIRVKIRTLGKNSEHVLGDVATLCQFTGTYLGLVPGEFLRQVLSTFVKDSLPKSLNLDQKVQLISEMVRVERECGVSGPAYLAHLEALIKE